MTIGSLCSGIGGLELGLERAGLGPCLWNAEIDPFCRAVLAKNWPDAKQYEDAAHAIFARPVDVLCAGIPCQGHSVAGKRKGEKDERWIWPIVTQVIKGTRPQVIVIENVPGLRTSGLQTVLADLAALGFNAEWTVFAAGHVGAPHLRERLWIVAYRDGASLRLEPGRQCGQGRQGAPESQLSSSSRGLHELPADGGGEQALRLVQPRHATEDPSGSSSSRGLHEFCANNNNKGQLQQGWLVGAIRRRLGDLGLESPWATWPARAVVPRVVHGVPDELVATDRVARRAREKALGNAVVPRCAQVIGECIMEAFGS